MSDNADGSQASELENSFAVTDQMGLRDSLTVTITHPQTPGWTTLWAQIGRRMARLRGWYDGTQPSVGNAEMEDEVDSLLTCLNHLADWLGYDDVNLGSITKQAVDDYVLANHALALCRDYANSFKHHTREATKKNPDPGYARLYQAETSTGSNMTITVRYWSNTQQERTIDALAFAEQCHQAWLDFFAQEGIALPS